MTDKETNKLEHPCFPQPPDMSVHVWKYMDLSKLIWILQNQKLYLPRLDLLNDLHEGSYPPAVVKSRNNFFEEKGLDNILERVKGMGERMRAASYVSCWHMNNNESEAMWRLYCSSNKGVAIRSSYQRLVNSTASDSNFFIGCVQYIDYETQWFPIDNLFYPIMHKRIAFAHENEVRLVKSLTEHWIKKGSLPPDRIEVDWNIDDVIDNIYINPYAPDWYSEVVHYVIDKFRLSLSNKVQWSKMKSKPIY